MNQFEQRSQRGAALITVLMIVAAMSAVALGVTQAVLHATERARALDGQAQLRYYAIAAEAAARARLFETLGPIEGHLSSDYPGYGEAQLIPVEGGQFFVTVRDATNCFNLNSLVRRADDNSLESDLEQVDRLIDLFNQSEVETLDAVSLSSAILDWMDRDSIAATGGAEDSYYLGLSPSYRTAGQPLASLQELRAIRGFDAETYTALKALLCVRPPETEGPPHRLNLNTLEELHAPLLTQLLPSTLTLEEAQALIANRPLGGWPDLAAFQQEPLLAQIDPSLIDAQRLSVQTSLVEVQADVSYRDQTMRIRFLFETLPGKPVRTLQRQRIG